MTDPTWKRVLVENQAELGALQGNLLSAAGGSPVRTLLVTSPRPGEGKTTSAAFLAQGLATHAKQRVLLVDGHLRSPKLHEIFGIEESPGLTEVLAAPDQLDPSIRPTETRNLHLLTCGSDAAGSADALDPDGISGILDRLKAKYDIIIVDADAVLSSSDTWVLAKAFDGVLVVVECEKTKWEVLELCRDKIVKAGGTVLGVILNKRKYYVPKALYGRL